MSSDITQVDVRGPRFAAWITTAVLVSTLIASAFSAPVAAVILSAQAVVFAIGAFRGPRSSPYGALFAKLGDEYERRYGLQQDHLTRIAEINFANARRTPFAQTRAWFTDESQATELRSGKYDRPVAGQTELW